MNQKEIEKNIENILKRNIKVEKDKAWETSNTRKILIFLFTYLLILIFLIIIENSKPWLNALIPTLAYLIGTSTFPIIKKLWINKIYK